MICIVLSIAATTGVPCNGGVSWSDVSDRSMYIYSDHATSKA